MARVVVDVMLKPEILDPQGQAVANALPRLGVSDVASVRIGRRIEIEFAGEADLDRAREIADKLLANPVIEDFTIRRRGRRSRGRVTMRIGVVTFPGSLDDRDAARAVRLAGAEAVRLWHGDPDLHGVDAVVLPGGFSYGDYLRCGAIARFAPVMETIADAARDGLPVLGICNGFQILCEAHLLPGALTRNQHLHFRNRDQWLRIESTATAWTNALHRGPGDPHPGQERRGLLRRRRSAPSTSWRPTAGSSPATSAATRTARSATSRRSRNEAGNVSASCPTRSTRSRR